MNYKRKRTVWGPAGNPQGPQTYCGYLLEEYCGKWAVYLRGTQLKGHVFNCVEEARQWINVGRPEHDE